MLIKYSLLQLAAIGVMIFSGQAGAQSQTPFPGSSIPQFVDALPSLPVLDGTQPLELHMREFEANVLSTGTFTPGVAPSTIVWGYISGSSAPIGPQSTYAGPVIIAQQGIPTEIRYVNDLGTVSQSQLLAYKNSTDQTIHWADPLNAEMNACAEQAMMTTAPNETPSAPSAPCNQNYDGPIPATIHLHGGEVPPQIDGNPDSWFTSDPAIKGPAFHSRDGSTATNYAIYRYPNASGSEPLWFHDHTLGVTRLNVFAGLAGIYLITNPATDPSNLPPLIPLLIQDRMFDSTGQLFFTAGPGYATTPEHPFWKPEFFGDAIVVNGKTWPYLEVEPKRYRFLFLNGSNARAYRMNVASSNGQSPPMWQIATDGGYLDKPVKIGSGNGKNGSVRQLLLMPAERADVVIDFSDFSPGTQLLLTNNARAPFPSGDIPDADTLGRIMQFRMIPLTSADTTVNLTSRTRLQPPMIRLANPARGELARGVKVKKTRLLTLNELTGSPLTVNGVEYPGDSRGILLNNTRWNGESSRQYNDFTPVTSGPVTNLYSELGQEGETELWEIVNLTMDAHPIHVHLVEFQLVNRQPFREQAYTAAYQRAFPGNEFVFGFGPPRDYRPGKNRLSGGKYGGNPDVTPYLLPGKRPPEANEAGWKDTIVVYPGEVTRVVIRWAPTSLPARASARKGFYPFNPFSSTTGYVWHCHILDHEDNEMMRPFSVSANPRAERSFVLGVDY